MKLTVTLYTGNDAFGPYADDCAAETARILASLGQYFQAHWMQEGDSGSLQDSNGNKVGSWHIAD